MLKLESCIQAFFFFKWCSISFTFQIAIVVVNSQGERVTIGAGVSTPWAFSIHCFLVSLTCCIRAYRTYTLPMKKSIHRIIIVIITECSRIIGAQPAPHPKEMHCQQPV